MKKIIVKTLFDKELQEEYHIPELKYSIKGTEEYDYESALYSLWAVLSILNNSLSIDNIHFSFKNKDKNNLKELIDAQDFIENNEKFSTFLIYKLSLEGDEEDNLVLISNKYKEKLLFLLKLFGIKYNAKPDFKSDIEELESASKEDEDPYKRYGIDKKDFI